MKSRKVVAGLLFVVMMLTLVPMWQVSAVETTYESLEDIVGTELEAYKSFDMSNTDYQSGSGFVFKPEGEHTAENGALIQSDLEGGRGFWRYYSGSENWSPLALGYRAAYFKLKVLEGQSVEVKIQALTGGSEYGSFMITPTSFGVNDFKNLDYAREGGAGTDFVEYFAVAESNTKIHLYAKGLTADDTWVLAATASEYKKSDSSSMGLYFAGDCYLKEVILYHYAEEKGVTYQSIEEITGFPVMERKTYDFTAENAEELYSGVTGIEAVDTTFDTTDGMTVASRWRIGNNNSSSLGKERAIYFRARVTEGNTAMVYLHIPDTTGDQDAYEVKITPEAVTHGNYSTGMEINPFVPGTDFVEYLAVDREDGKALKVYAKQGDSWSCILNIQTFNTSLSASSEVYFVGPVSVQELILYDELIIYDSIRDVVGKDIVEEDKLEFTNDSFQTKNMLMYIPESYDATNGITLGSAPQCLRYAVDGYSPVENRAFTFRAKADGSNYTTVYIHDYHSEENSYAFRFNASGFDKPVYTNADNPSTVVMDKGFIPGNEWVDYLVKENAEGTGVEVYAKFDNGKWSPIFGINGYPSDTSLCHGLMMFGAGNLTDVTIYNTSMTIYDTVEEFVQPMLYPYKKFTFTDEKASEKYTPNGIYEAVDVTFDSNGLTLKETVEVEGSAPRWRYVPEDGWSALADDRVVYFKAKVSEKDDVLNIYLKQPNDTTETQDQAYALTMTKVGITPVSTGEVMINFAPGTKWAEFYAIHTESGMNLYAKQDGFAQGKWVLILKNVGTKTISKKSALYFAGEGMVEEAVIYDTAVTFTTKDTMEDVIGKAVPIQYLDFDTAFDVTLNETALILKEPTLTEQGMYFTGGADWRAKGFGGKTGWSPLDEGNVAVFRAKVSDGDDVFYAYMKSPLNAEGKVAIMVTTEGVTINQNKDVDKKFNFAPDTDWAEYLVRGNESQGYDVWVKAESFGDTKWRLLATTTAYCSDTDSTNLGYRFLGNETCDAYLDYAHVYSTSGVTEEEDTKPENAEFIYFEENFDETNSIHNVAANGVTVTDGNMVIAEGKPDGNYKIVNTSIPKGGYAEFRTAGPAINRLKFYDGTGYLQLSFNGYGTAVGVSGTEQGIDSYTFTDGGNTFRTWRVLRNQDGTYSGFFQNDQSDVWIQAFENKEPVPDTTEQNVYILMGNTKVKYDYFKICGPVPEKEFVLYDGFSTKEIAITEGAGELTYYAYLRGVVRQGTEAKNLIFAEFKDDRLTNIAVHPISTGTGAEGFSYRIKDKSADLRVFFWDSFGSMKNRNEGVRLTIAQ